MAFVPPCYTYIFFDQLLLLKNELIVTWLNSSLEKLPKVSASTAVLLCIELSIQFILMQDYGYMRL